MRKHAQLRSQLVKFSGLFPHFTSQRRKPGYTRKNIYPETPPATTDLLNAHVRVPHKAVDIEEKEITNVTIQVSPVDDHVDNAVYECRQALRNRTAQNSLLGI